MSSHQHLANIRCLAPEQVVHLQYCTNSLFEDDPEISPPSALLVPHHDPYHIEGSNFASKLHQNGGKKSVTKKPSTSISEPKEQLPVLSSEEHYHVHSWAFELDQLVLDFCCALVDRQYGEAALTANASTQTLEPCPSTKRRTSRRR